jgi:CheY-like chemotaxis protein
MKPILVVDDHPDTRACVSELLRGEGYAVVEAENGKVAFELMQAGGCEPCLIILDLEMPIMTGREFLARIGDDRRRIPVLVTTGSAVRLEELMSSNVVGLLRKPYGWDRLLAGIASLGCPRFEER